MPASALLSVTLFLLSADLLYLTVDGNKVKYGYLLILAMWILAPGRMFATAKAALSRVPRIYWLMVLPAAIAVMTSINLKSSALWALWLGFDLFTVLTVYAFLKTHDHTPATIEAAITGSLAMIVAFGLFQFIAIYGFNRVVFSPQFHADSYRINGISGWPHFLNIFSFLLLPLIVQRTRLAVVTKVVLVLLAFLLVQSTAKTGWVLAAGLGVLLAMFNREAFLRNFVFLLVPAAVVAILLPTPSITTNGTAVSGTEKLSKFAEDLDVTKPTTSGTDRVLINAMGVAVWLKHPWFGVGPKAYNTYVWTRFDQELPDVKKLDGNHNVNAKNENVWIEFLSECGAVFTLGFAAIIGWTLWPRRRMLADPLALGAWMALVLYFVISAQVSQNGLLTMVYAMLGIYLYARERCDKEGSAARLKPEPQRPWDTLD